MTKYLTSNATIRPDPATFPIWIVECPNPESLLSDWIRRFFTEMRFAEMYPKFGDIRIGNVHPFAMLLFQDVMGVKPDLSVFPSITVSDSSEMEEPLEIGRGFEALALTPEYVAEVDGYVRQGRLMVSPTSLTYLKAAVAGGDSVAGVHTTYRGSHRIDVNIWSENKTVGGIIFDMVKAFINSKRGDLHERGISVVGALDGRRSGDISVEWGRLLYGSNLTIPCMIEAGAMRIDLDFGIIQSVVVEPTYHAGEYEAQIIPPLS